jgi:phosphatidylinositol alpha 1,6-mannosyltransferase
MKAHPRVAFFPDSFGQADGVSIFAREFAAYASRHEIRWLTVFAGQEDSAVQAGTVTRITLPRSKGTFALDSAHHFDLFFLRHLQRAAAQLREFQPDFIQITGPGDAGILGALLAHRLKLPLAAFWQTDLPRYAGLRAAGSLSWLPAAAREPVAALAERGSGWAVARYYRLPRLLFAPNPGLVAELTATHADCRLLGHGADTDFFDPAKRDRSDAVFTIGYVGRLAAEKSVRDLVWLAGDLRRMGHKNFRFSIAGDGPERRWLEANLQPAEFHGVLHGADLARAFANMDVFAFPSRTDTYGLVVLEALASGVPAVVTNAGGPQYTVHHGRTGFIARTREEFSQAIGLLLTSPALLASMRQPARRYALEHTWDHAFDRLYADYAEFLEEAPAAAGRM